MIDNHIYPLRHRFADGHRAPAPANMDATRQALIQPRPSLSPSRFTDSDFERFVDKNHCPPSETVMLRDVLPIITGHSDIPNAGDVLFTDIATITNNATTKPKPDFFDGARAVALGKAVKNEVGTFAVPVKRAEIPVAPNFFLEAKSPSGRINVAQRQVLQDGAVGARAMHVLQTCSGHLELSAHLAAAPTATGQPSYYMTQAKAYAITSDANSFRSGATALRNLWDSAETDRNASIQGANAVALTRQAEAPAEDEITVGGAQYYEDSTSDGFVDCEDYTSVQGAPGPSNIAGFGTNLYDGGYGGYDAAGPSTSFATGFTSSPSRVEATQGDQQSPVEGEEEGQAG
ncbi:hypothetical protein N0V88_007069 [Collariella sp. IMI 366227]|nr:hypothetical protein N0V88_007069 [Collariella sp. IMI 366227]